MRLRTRLTAIGAVSAVAATTAFAGTALADFPDFTGCTTGVRCMDVQSTGGNLTIKKLNIALPANAVEIRGDWASNGTLTPADGTTGGIISQPVVVPGGIFGISFPLPGNRLTLTVEKAGTDAINISSALEMRVPVKLVLKNSILGTCTVGTDAAPIALDLITGTTNPPAPNQPITGRRGTQTVFQTYTRFAGNVNVDNSFALKGAKGCNIAAAVIMDSALRAPSKAGKNALVFNNDLALSK